MTEKYAAQLSRSLLKIALRAAGLITDSKCMNHASIIFESVILGVRFKGLFAIYKMWTAPLTVRKSHTTLYPLSMGVHLSGLEFDTRV